MPTKKVLVGTLVLQLLSLVPFAVIAQTSRKSPLRQGTLSNVAALTGADACETKLLTSEPLHSRLKALLGTDYEEFEVRSGMCGFPVDMISGIVITKNMQPHYGGQEESMLAIDPKNNAILVKILHGGKIYTYREPGHPLILPGGWMGTNDEWKRAAEVPGRLHGHPPQLGPNS